MNKTTEKIASVLRSRMDAEAGPLNRISVTTEIDSEDVSVVLQVLPTGRPTIDDYYLGIARAVAARAECSRRQVGAVIVRNQSIVGTGFNGAPPGEMNCLDGACPRATSGAAPGTGYAATSCVVVHAETNAIIRAGRDRCLGATLYVTSECCDLCAPLVRAAGIIRVVTPMG